jgi:hypothetical protein
VGFEKRTIWRIFSELTDSKASFGQQQSGCGVTLKNDKKVEREALPEPVWGDEPSFDCGLGLYLTENAGP